MEHADEPKEEDKDSSFISNPPEYAEYMDATREETDYEELDEDLREFIGEEG